MKYAVLLLTLKLLLFLYYINNIPKKISINKIVDILGGEKLDVVRYSENPAEYVAAALAPADVRSVEFSDERSCKVVVDSDQLSLAIGKEGQNARLAARLTGYKIDIKSE